MCLPWWLLDSSLLEHQSGWFSPFVSGKLKSFTKKTLTYVQFGFNSWHWIVSFESPISVICSCTFEGGDGWIGTFWDWFCLELLNLLEKSTEIAFLAWKHQDIILSLEAPVSHRRSMRRFVSHWLPWRRVRPRPFRAPRPTVSACDTPQPLWNHLIQIWDACG